MLQSFPIDMEVKGTHIGKARKEIWHIVIKRSLLMGYLEQYSPKTILILIN